MTAAEIKEHFELKFRESQLWQRIFKGPAWKKILHYPKRILLGRLRWLLLPRSRSSRLVNNRLFWGDEFFTEGYFLDYYLCGFISEDNEVRFTRYLMNRLKPGITFFDIGTHYGFYSLLAYQLLGGNNLSGPSVHSFEPTSATFKVFQRNIAHRAIRANQVAVSRFNGEALLHVFAKSGMGVSNTLYAEQAQSVLHKKPTQTEQVATIALDSYCLTTSVIPEVIKIDAEGAEHEVLAGGLGILSQHHPEIVMEIWPAGENSNHEQALLLLLKLGYQAYTITEQGQPRTADWKTVLASSVIDNIIFRHPDARAVLH